MNGEVSNASSKPCPFCLKFGDAKGPFDQRKWYDRPVFETEMFVAVPALGQLVAGYLLLIPREHIFSMAQLPLDRLQLLEWFRNHAGDALEDRWGRPILFEHGACSDNQPAGACVAHAHWHIVPGDFDLLFPTQSFRSVRSFKEFAEKTRGVEPYLYFEDQAGCGYILDESNPPSQFFRRRLAIAIGRPGAWDYAAFPFFENIRETYDYLGPLSLRSPS